MSHYRLPAPLRCFVLTPFLPCAPLHRPSVLPAFRLVLWSNSCSLIFKVLCSRSEMFPDSARDPLPRFSLPRSPRGLHFTSGETELHRAARSYTELYGAMRRIILFHAISDPPPSMTPDTSEPPAAAPGTPTATRWRREKLLLKKRALGFVLMNRFAVVEKRSRAITNDIVQDYFGPPSCQCAPQAGHSKTIALSPRFLYR